MSKKKMVWQETYNKPPMHANVLCKWEKQRQTESGKARSNTAGICIYKQNDGKALDGPQLSRLQETFPLQSGSVTLMPVMAQYD